MRTGTALSLWDASLDANPSLGSEHRSGFAAVKEAEVKISRAAKVPEFSGAPLRGILRDRLVTRVA
jgi:hypothetical protein